MNPAAVDQIGQKIEDIAHLLRGPELTHSQAEYLRDRVRHLNENIDFCDRLPDE